MAPPERWTQPPGRSVAATGYGWAASSVAVLGIAPASVLGSAVSLKHGFICRGRILPRARTRQGSTTATESHHMGKLRVNEYIEHVPN